MATLDQFLEKALNEGAPPFLDPSKQVYYADVEFKIELTGVKNMKDAMKRAQRFVDDTTKKFKLFDPQGGVTGIDGPM